MKRLLILLFATVAQAQTIGLQGGASTLFPAEGGSIHLFTQNTEETLGGGISNGKFVASASSEFLFHGFNTTIGDRQIFLSGGQLGLSTVVRGVSFSRKGMDDTFSGFAGAVGSAFSTPFYSGLQAHRLGLGFQFTKKFEPRKKTSCRGAGCAVNAGTLELSTVSAYTLGKLTVLQGAVYRWHGLTLQGTGGLLEGKKYLVGDASWRLQHAAFDIGRQTFIWQSQRNTVQTGSVSTWFGAVTAHASAFSSHQASGENAGTGLRLGPVQVNGDIFFARQQRIFSGSVIEKLSRHFSVSQFYTRSGGQSALNFGGSFTSNPVSLSVGWQQQFIPFGNIPFQKVLSVTLAFQLPHGTMLNLATVAAPTGGTRWSAYGGTYQNLPGELSAATGRGGGHAIRGYLVSGYVRDSYGPVEGIAVQVGNVLAYSNADGRFEARFKKNHQVSVSVMLAESTAPGSSWEVVSLAGTATPASGVPIQIVIRRK
jgi:hypothetical protein